MKRTKFLQAVLLTQVGVLACAVLLTGQVRGGQTPQSPARERKDGVEMPVVTSGYLVLIRDPVVQQHLKLSRNQRQAIQQLTDTIDEPLWKIRALPPRKHAAALQQLIAKTRPEISKVLSRQQSERLDQIVLRTGWPQSLLFDDVREDLGFSGAQLQQIVDKFIETQRARAGLHKPPNKGTAVDDFHVRAKALEAEWRALLVDTLDDNQHRKLTALLGGPFDATGLGNVKFKAPPLDGSDGWINSRPLSMRRLRGQVVVLHYWTYG